MATPYSKVYERFLQKVTDFNLVEFDDNTLDKMLLGWLSSAIVKMRKCQHDLSLRDDGELTFNEDLSDLEIELLAMGMLDSWITPQIASTELTLQFIGGKEEKMFSQSSHLAELRNIREQNLLEMNRLHLYYT